MEQKKSNLVVRHGDTRIVGKMLLTIFQTLTHKVAADVMSKSELLSLADNLGPHICMLKTHADIIQDWDSHTGASSSPNLSSKPFCVKA